VAAIHQLYGQKIALDFTDHLSDRQLYCVLMRDILPVYQKKISDPRHFLHWHCLDENDIEDRLRYYATDEERERWSDETELPLPGKKPLPFPRQMPRANQAISIKQRTFASRACAHLYLRITSLTRMTICSAVILKCLYN
jgi:hypothetical protein